ncbi:MAG: zinc ribbon domain-containing protein, partial [Candidatus Helarchaeota archaeon]|nr:zinc ribbon domain-containing protein [Candidatus Helarchaeota archaeon]
SRLGCSVSPCYPWVFTNPGGLIALFGLLLFIPVLILTIVFLATQSSACESTAFGLAFPSWFLVIIGAGIGLYYTVTSFLIPALLIVFMCPQIILGFGLFARRNYGTDSMPPPRGQVPYRTYPNRPPVNRGAPRSGRGITIPEEVRMAGTYGQAVKRCVQCGNTLDIKTAVCFYCGARQPVEAVRYQPPVSPPPATRMPAQGPAHNEFLFCPSCGARVYRGHLFCTSCGSSLEL